MINPCEVHKPSSHEKCSHSMPIHVQGLQEILKPKHTNLHAILDSFDATMADFLENLLQLDPDRRFSAAEALQHPWIQSVISYSI